jgi:DNA-binding ferritin-like protein
MAIITLVNRITRQGTAPEFVEKTLSRHSYNAQAHTFLSDSYIKNIFIIKKIMQDDCPLLSCFIKRMFAFQHSVKMLHWRTKSYSIHKATDKLLNVVPQLIDQFVESYLGKYGKTSDNIMSNSFTVKIKSFSPTGQNATTYIKSHVDFLTAVRKKLGTDELVNILDEMTSALDQTMYLLQLN